MPKTIVFEDSFLVAGIMCHGGCGSTITDILNSSIALCKTKQLLPENVQLIIDAEPQALGIHRLFITIECEDQLEIDTATISEVFKQGIEKQDGAPTRFQVLDNTEGTNNDESSLVNWINILINLASMGIILLLTSLFPPSLLLTIGLTSLSFLTTAFTTRHYLINFFANLRNKHFTTMSTPITLGWLLSLAHTLYHTISMPLTASFSMTFMSFIMPIVLITVINGMDEIKRLIYNKSKKMHLEGMKTLFPQMAEKYHYYPLSEAKESILTRFFSDCSINPECNDNMDEFLQTVDELLENEATVMQSKSALKAGMIIKIMRGDCFPVDCILLQGTTQIDAAILTGEPQQIKKCLDTIPAGAINLGQTITVYAKEDSYNSTVNKLLFRSNRAKEKNLAKPNLTFTYFYSILILLGISASLLIPLILGTFTVPLLLQNVIGILFAVCPCTITIAHELPFLLSTYQRSKQGITLRDEELIQSVNEIHTVVFDKTGTLTTGNSKVESTLDISDDLWARIYLLEKQQGAEHPLAKAITKHYEATLNNPIMFNDIHEAINDPNHRGLSAIVQGRKIHIGNADYLRQEGISVPELYRDKLAQGFSPVYVAQDNIYQGVIFIKHEIRENIVSALNRLKAEGKNIIMLTGDNFASASGFNQQNGSIFNESDIHAQKTPEQKEAFLSTLMTTNPQGVWFVGDGLNDAPCARTVSEKGGTSCAMTSEDKAAFFTDISLDGSLEYLFEHNNLNQFLQKNVLQNQLLLTYSFVAFLAFIMTFSIIGIAVSPLIPLMIMVSTTLLTVFNSYRVQLAIDNALDKNNTSWLKQFLASDLSISLLLGASLLFVCSVLISTATIGTLTLPIITFTAGILSALSSVCLLLGLGMVAFFSLVAAAYFFTDEYRVDQSPSVPFISPSLERANLIVAEQNPCIENTHEILEKKFDFVDPSFANLSP